MKETSRQILNSNNDTHAEAFRGRALIPPVYSEVHPKIKKTD